MPVLEKKHQKKKSHVGIDIENDCSQSHRSKKKKRKREHVEKQGEGEVFVHKKVKRKKMEIVEAVDTSIPHSHVNQNQIVALENVKNHTKHKKNKKKSKDVDVSKLDSKMESMEQKKELGIHKSGHHGKNKDLGRFEPKRESSKEAIGPPKKKTKKKEKEIKEIKLEELVEEKHKKKKKKKNKKKRIKNEMGLEETFGEFEVEKEKEGRKNKGDRKNEKNQEDKVEVKTEVVCEIDNVCEKEEKKKKKKQKKKKEGEQEFEMSKLPKKELTNNEVTKKKVQNSTNGSDDESCDITVDLNLCLSSASSDEENSQTFENLMISVQKKKQAKVIKNKIFDIKEAKNKNPSTMEGQANSNEKETKFSSGRKNKETQKVIQETAKKSKIETKKKTYRQPVQIKRNENSNNELLLKWKLTPADLDFLKKQGITWEKGRWSKEEIQLLEANIEKAVAHTGLSHKEFFEKLMGKKGKVRDERFTDIYRMFVQGINRPLKVVFEKVMRTYDPYNNKGNWTAKEEKQLLELYQKHGNQWAEIGENMKRSKFAIAHKIRRLVNFSSNGDFAEIPSTIISRKWKTEEVYRLQEAISKVLDDKKGQNANSGQSSEVMFNWEAIASEVKTRSSESCRTKWIYDLSLRDKASGKKLEWNRENTGLLISNLIETGVTLEKKIDWDTIVEKLQLPVSGPFLKLRWKSLKVMIPNCREKSLNEQLSWLEQKYL